MPTWPATLPTVLLTEGQREGVPNTLLRSTMDAGPAKVRRRHTAGVRTVAGRLILSTAQVATLETFLVTTLAGGSLAFDWTHPRTGAATSYRVVPASEDTLVSYHPLGGDWWDVPLRLEVLP